MSENSRTFRREVCHQHDYWDDDADPECPWCLLEVAGRERNEAREAARWASQLLPAGISVPTFFVNAACAAGKGGGDE